jgi:F-type H+-transporting ATPase subunit delta
MSAEKLSRRYAKALFDEAVSKASLDAVHADLDFIKKTLKSSRELKAVLKSPIIQSYKKQAIVTETFAGNVGALTQDLLKLLVSQSRAGYLPDIIVSFFRMYNDSKGISEVKVTTATEMDADNEQKIVEYIKAKSGYPNVKINKKVDAAILGGFIVDFGGKLLDNSVRYKLEKIEKELSSN